MGEIKKGVKKRFALGLLGLLAFFVFFSVYYINKNLDNVVNYILNQSLKYNIYVENIDIGKFGQIEAQNIILRDKEGRLVLEVPAVEIQYNLKDMLRGKYVTRLWAKTPKVYLTIYELTKLNIMDSLNLYEEKKEKDKPSPIQYIKVTEGILFYKDISYNKPVNLTLNRLNGHIDMRSKMKLQFEGLDIKDSSQSFFFSQEEYEKNKYQFIFRMNNVDLRDELMQYAFDDKDTITYIDGKADVDISFGDKGVSGQAFLKNARVKYELLKDEFIKVEASVNIDKDDLDIFAKAKLQKYPVNLKLSKRGEKLGIYFDTKKVPLSYVFDNLPEQDIYKDIAGEIDTLKGQLVFDNINDPTPPIELYATSKEVNYLEHNLKNVKLNLDFDSVNEKFLIKNLDFDYSNKLNPQYFVNFKTKLNGIYENDKLQMNYSLVNKGSFFENSKFNGSFEYDLEKNNFTLKNTDTVYPFTLFYDLNKDIVKLKGNFNESIRFFTDKTKKTSFKGNVDIEYNIPQKILSKAIGNVNFTNEILGMGEIVFFNTGEILNITNASLQRQNSYGSLKAKINTRTLEYQGEVTELNVQSREMPIIKTIDYLSTMPDFSLETAFSFSGKEKDFEADFYNVKLKTDNSSISGRGKFNSGNFSYSGSIYEGIIDSKEFPIIKTIEQLKTLPDFTLNAIFDFSGLQKEFELDFSQIKIKTNNSLISGRGKFNSGDLSYKGEVYQGVVDSKDLDILKDYPEFVLNTSFTIEGVKDNFKLDYKAQIEKINQGLEFNKISFEGLIEYKSGDIFGNTEGYIREILYGDFSFKDLYVNLEFDKNKLIVEKILNAHLFINGIYFLDQGLLDLSYQLIDYDLERVKASEYQIKGNIGKITGTVKNTLENPTISLKLDKAYINYNNTENANVYGSLLLKDNILILEDFYFKENKLTGTVNLKEEAVNLKVNLLETNLNSYYKDTNVKYRVIGIVNIWGRYKDLRAVAQVNLDNIYYRGNKIPDLFLKLSYIDGDLYEFSNSGKLNLTELKILGDNGFNLMEADGYLDIATKKFDLKLGNDNIAIKDIEYLINEYKLKGKLNLDFEAKGYLTGKIDYSLYLNSTELSYNNIIIDRFSTKIIGTEKKLKVEYMEMNYDNNTLNAQGDFNIEDNTYNFSIKAKDVNLGLFNLFLSQKVRNIGGKADIDIVLKTDESLGTLELKNASLESLDKSIVLSKLNSKVELNKDGIKINSFTGSLNNGTILLDGYLKMPKFSEDLLVNPMEALKDYSLNIKLNNVDYSYDRTVFINLDTNLNFTENLLTGEIRINRGNVFKLPNLSKSEAGEESIIPINANIEINIGEGIYFTADNIPLIEDIELKIEGGGILEIKNNKINFIGKLFSEDGALTFNNSIFSVNTAIIIFDGIHEYFPNVDPSLAIKAQTKVQSEEIYITISGYYSNLNLSLLSSSGLSVQDITNLLLFKTSSGSNVNTFVKDILDKQFSEEIFNPLSRELEKLLNISKVRISSKLLKLDENSLSLSPDFLLGAEFEIGNSFYKDKFFWNLKTKFSNEKSGEIIGGDLWLDYKLNNNLAWKLGVEQDKEFFNSDKENYYLGIDFKYQRDSIFKKK